MTDNLRKFVLKLDVTSVRAVTYAAIFTFLTAMFTIIAFSTPNWLVADNKQPVKRFEKLGLWEACFHTFRDTNYLYDREFRGCKWLFDEDYAFLLDFLEPRISSALRNTSFAKWNQPFRYSPIEYRASVYLFFHSYLLFMTFLSEKSFCINDSKKGVLKMS